MCAHGVKCGRTLLRPQRAVRLPALHTTGVCHALALPLSPPASYHHQFNRPDIPPSNHHYQPPPLTTSTAACRSAVIASSAARGSAARAASAAASAALASPDPTARSSRGTAPGRSSNSRADSSARGKVSGEVG